MADIIQKYYYNGIDIRSEFSKQRTFYVCGKLIRKFMISYKKFDTNSTNLTTLIKLKIKNKFYVTTSNVRVFKRNVILTFHK